MNSNTRSASLGAVAALALSASLGAVGADPPVRVAGIPAPEDIVCIEVDQNYEVPADSHLVITGVASSGIVDWSVPEPIGYEIAVDNVAVLSGSLKGPITACTAESSVSYSPGFRVDEPATVRIRNLSDRYLETLGVDPLFDPVLTGYIAKRR